MLQSYIALIWLINSKSELTEDSNASISISTRFTGQEDPYGYIKNFASEIDIRVDQDFMQLLKDMEVDLVPQVS